VINKFLLKEINYDFYIKNKINLQIQIVLRQNQVYQYINNHKNIKIIKFKI